jgi:hypothetical protein
MTTAQIAAMVSASLVKAIARSESNNETVDVTMEYLSDISTVAAYAADHADNVDYANEGDGTYDVWGWSDEMEEAGKGDMQWRLRVTLAAE